MHALAEREMAGDHAGDVEAVRLRKLALVAVRRAPYEPQESALRDHRAVQLDAPAPRQLKGQSTGTPLAERWPS